MSTLPVSANLHRFNGGIRFPHWNDPSTRAPIAAPPLPEELVLPLRQHIGDAAEPCVKVGQHVLKGQPIAHSQRYIGASIHAPTSGTVVAIDPEPIPHPSGLEAPCIRLRADGEDRWVEKDTSDADYRQVDPGHLRNRIREAGIVGLGGAAFPSAVKLNPGPSRKIHTLIINAAECEPYINCDDMLLRERAAEVVAGIDIIRYCLGVDRCQIGIEDSMPEAHAALSRAIAEAGAGIEVVVVPTIYPTGGEKQLIKVMTGREVPRDGLPADIGLVCHNVGTAYAIARAILHGEPLISRIVTVTGEGVRAPQNLEVLFGTPVRHLIDYCGGYTDHVSRLLMGGHMMGFALHSDQLPVVKAANCILAGTPDELPEPEPPNPCIRCGLCEQACPVNLLPQQLYWYAKARDFDQTREYNLFDCIECGCCSYVCPSKIPLVQYYRYAKTEIWNAEREREKSDIARQRFEFRQQRLEREEREKKEKMRKRKETLKSKNKDSKQAAIEAAKERVQAKKAEQTEKPGTANERE